MKKQLLAAGVSGFLCFYMMCTVSEKKGSILPDQSQISHIADSANVPASAKIDGHHEIDIIPEKIEPQQWLNLSFVLLPKPAMFQKFGYEVYRCADKNQCSESDTFYLLSSKRIRYDRFAGDTLNVTAVSRDTDGEWLVTLFDKRYSMTLYAHTRKSALTEMVLLKDFEAGYNRWRGKCVFSSKGVISSAGVNGNLSSVKVRRCDSLMVYEVRYGLSPLPVNPIWLMVKSNNGIEGFIPVRYSWSNVMTDQILEGLPWIDDILEFNPIKKYAWDAVTWELIENHRVTVGMEKAQIVMSWGRPVQKADTTVNGMKLQCWKYPAQKLYFNEISLITIEDVAVK
jgi:hypothetical protein